MPCHWEVSFCFLGRVCVGQLLAEESKPHNCRGASGLVSRFGQSAPLIPPETMQIEGYCTTMVGLLMSVLAWNISATLCWWFSLLSVLSTQADPSAVLLLLTDCLLGPSDTG